MRWSAIFSALAVLPAMAMATEPQDVASAARHFLPNLTWQEESVLVGDFSCHGNQEFAILGTSREVIAVAIFLRGLDSKPEVLEYSTRVRNASYAILTVEPFGSSLEAIESDIGYIPEGMRPSTSCTGLGMSDQEIDAAHIYWNHEQQRFSDWVR